MLPVRLPSAKRDQARSSGRVPGGGVAAAVHVDVVDAMLIAAVNSPAVGQRFLVSELERVTWDAFYGKLAQAVGVKGQIYMPIEPIGRENTRLAKARRFLSSPERIIRTAQVSVVRKALTPLLGMLPVNWETTRRMRRTGRMRDAAGTGTCPMSATPAS